MPELPNWTTPLERTTGWESRFVETVERHMASPFEWGVSDCLTVVADVCDAICGRDPMPARLRHYRDEGAAMALMAALGFAGVTEALVAVFPEIGLRRARRGDCGVLEASALGPACFIVLGANAVGKGAAGPIYVPVTRLARTFAIGSP
jgi:hypothetical protein